MNLKNSEMFNVIYKSSSLDGATKSMSITIKYANSMQ